MLLLGLGSNLPSTFGDRFENLNLAISYLEAYKIKIIKKSSFYETPSYPNNTFPSFLNIGVLIDYKNNETSLIKNIHIIEKKIGRVRSKKNEPRVCDIDIIDFKGLVVNNKNLKIPHPKCHMRNFVLYPIMEIDKKWIHPILNKNVIIFKKKTNI